MLIPRDVPDAEQPTDPDHPSTHTGEIERLRCKRCGRWIVDIEWISDVDHPWYGTVIPVDYRRDLDQRRFSWVRDHSDQAAHIKVRCHRCGHWTRFSRAL